MPFKDSYDLKDFLGVDKIPCNDCKFEATTTEEFIKHVGVHAAIKYSEKWHKDHKKEKPKILPNLKKMLENNIANDD